MGAIVFFCPKCKSRCFRESIDVGVGIIYGPYGCPNCGWSEDEKYDNSSGPKYDVENGLKLDQYGNGERVPSSPNPLKSDDPAYWMLKRGQDIQNGSIDDPDWITTTTVYNQNCYICKDPEFSLMGLPLCYPCSTCGAHTPADSSMCDNGHSQESEYEDE